MRRSTSAPSATLPGDPREILVTALCPIGDTLFLTPALAALRRRFPCARITAVVSASNQGVLMDNPDVDALLLTPEAGPGPEAARFVRGVRRISQERPDLIVNFSAGGSIVTLLAGLRAPRLGLQMPPRWILVGARDQEYRDRHAIDHYFKAVEPVASPPLTLEERLPRFYLTRESRREARNLLRAAGARSGDVIVTMHAGGDGFNGRKRWAPERFAYVANALIERFDARILLIGGSADIPMSQEVAALIQGPARVLSGKTSLKVTGALIEASSLFIGNDSSPLHIAAAVGTPSIGIYGPSDWKEFHPVTRPGYRGRLLHSDLPCSPCFRFIGNAPLWQVNPCYSYACLKAIDTRHVLDAAVELLETPTPQRAPASAGAPKGS
jgi:ADP-heptose:LPS heptosyltransferase